MVAAVSSLGVSVSLPTAGGTRTATAGSARTWPDDVARSLETLAQLDPDSADALKQSLQTAEDTLNQLEATRRQLAEQRKAAALERIRQIHEGLKTLRLFATMDAKGSVRLATQWSRDLASAAKDYAEASGKTAAGSNSATALSFGPDGDIAIEPFAAGTSFEDIKARYNAALREQVLGEVVPYAAALPMTREHAEFAFAARSIKITLNATIDAAKWMMGDRLDYATARNVKTAKSAWRQMESHLRELSAAQRSAAFSIRT